LKNTSAACTLNLAFSQPAEFVQHEAKKRKKASKNDIATLLWVRWHSKWSWDDRKQRWIAATMDHEL